MDVVAIKNRFCGNVIRKTMRRAASCSIDDIPASSKIVFVGHSPPPIKRNLDRTSLGRFAELSGDANILSRIILRNVNEKNPGTRRRGSKAPERKEATFTAYSLLHGDGLDISFNRRYADEISLVFLLFGNDVAKAFRLYEEHSGRKHPLYQPIELPCFYGEESELVIRRFVVLLRHPSNANYYGNDVAKVRCLLQRICRKVR